MNIVKAQTEEQLQQVRILFREYEAALGIDLCFQDFEKEMANLPGRYAEPEGSLLLVMDGNKYAGCAAMRKMSFDDCELKRLFVRPQYRGTGIGRMLAQKIINRARQAGYNAIYLDTLKTMDTAIKLYRSLGFSETEPYYHNPLEGVVYLKLTLNK